MTAPGRRLLHVVLAAVVGAFTLWTFAAPASAAGKSTFTAIALWESGQGNVPFATATLTRPGFASLTDTADAFGNLSIADVPDGPWQVLVASPCGTQPPIDVVLPTDRLIVHMAMQHDAFGYRCKTSIQNQPAAGTPLALTGDDATASVALPFSFPFYGKQVDTITVSTNGWISARSSASAPANSALPSPGQPDLAVYAFWDDLLVDSAASVRTFLTGTGDHRLFEIQWLNVAVKSDPSQRLDTYVRLNEFNQSFIVYHFAVGTGAAEKGSGATVGIESNGGDTALEVSHDQAVAVNSRAYTFVPDPVPPVADAGDDQDVPSQGAFTLDASGSTNPDGGGLRFSWVQVTGPATPLEDPRTARPFATAPPGPATLKYRVTVTNLAGLTDIDDVVLSVNAPPSK